MAVCRTFCLHWFFAILLVFYARFLAYLVAQVVRVPDKCFKGGVQQNIAVCLPTSVNQSVSIPDSPLTLPPLFLSQNFCALFLKMACLENISYILSVDRASL